MKKIITILFLMFTISLVTHAEVQVYQAQSFACKTRNVYGGWTDWSDWEPSNVKVYIDINADQIYIASSTPQYYQITGTQNSGNSWRDNSGGVNAGFYAFRKSDYHRCEIRLRVEKNGNSQLYIDYNDALLCYNLIRIR